MLLAASVTQAAGEMRFADEDRDWGIAATSRLRQPLYHAPTPREIPGAQVVHTRELQAMLAGSGRPVLIDVLSGARSVTLSGASNTWSGGDMGGGGSTVIASGGVLNMSGGNRRFAGRTLTVDSGGALVWSGGSCGGECRPLRCCGGYKVVCMQQAM